MKQRLSTRKTVRLVSFALTGCIVLGGVAYSGYSLAARYRASLEYTYQRALVELSEYITNLETTLTKGIYANTRPQQQGLAAKLMHESGGAKAALGQLPLSDVELGNMNRFIAQVGDYAAYLSGKLSKGQALTQEEMDNLAALGGYAKTLNLDLQDLLARFGNGNLFQGEAQAVFHNLSDETQQQEEPLINNGFHEMNEGFTDFPTLIYDGPFSDHITQMRSKLLAEQPEVTEQEALQRAATFAGVPDSALSRTGDRGGNLPAYEFSGENLFVSVTLQGGRIEEMLNSRQIGEARMDYAQASANAKAFLEKHGMQQMKESYYVISEGICTINFAYQQDGITCYSDLVKVSVALDNGEIIAYNAAGYLMNHVKREIPQEKITIEQARESVSPSLTIEQEGMAFIPTPGLDEVLCYGFQCASQSGDKVLVYINAQTGYEEQILILLMSDGGVLVM